jgi:hypothetical protein
MKFLINSESNKAINLANVDEITISSNYLVLTTGGGQYARDVRFIYGTSVELTALFNRITEFLADDEKTLDCHEFLSGLR